MEKEKQKVREQSAYIWVDTYNTTKITMRIEDFLKVFKGKEVLVKVKV